MGLLDKLIDKLRPPKEATRPTLTTTTFGPTFMPCDCDASKSELVIAAVERFAFACSRLVPTCVGNARPGVRRFVETWPNDWQTWPVFFSRLGAAWMLDGTALVMPIYGPDMMSVEGLFPIRPSMATLADTRDGTTWVRFRMPTGRECAVPLADTCIMTKLQLGDDVFGERPALDWTLRLIDAQNQAQEAALQNGANIRFLAQANGLLPPEMVRKKREEFSRNNLGMDNDLGLAVYDGTFVRMDQVRNESYAISDSEMKRISDNIYRVFATNDHILTADYTEEQWDAYYESGVETFAVQFSQGSTKQCFTPMQVRHGNHIEVAADRLQYMSSPSKRNMVKDMTDRGVISINEGRRILQMPPLPPEEGDVRIIRGEYLNASAVSHMMNVEGGGRLEDHPYDSHEWEEGVGDLEYAISDWYGNEDEDK